MFSLFPIQCKEKNYQEEGARHEKSNIHNNCICLLFLLTACGSPSQTAQQQDLVAVQENTVTAQDTAEEPVLDSQTAKETAQIPDEATENTSDGVSPEFRETMDHYERFFNDYAAFMKEYSEADDPTSMLQDYADFLAQYTELTAELEAIEESELSEADVHYYLEVMNRINTILSEIAQQ